MCFMVVLSLILGHSIPGTFALQEGNGYPIRSIRESIPVHGIRESQIFKFGGMRGD